MSDAVNKAGPEIDFDAPDGHDEANQGGKRKVDPGFRRNIMFIGGAFGVSALLVLGVVVLKSGIAEKADAASSQLNVDISKSAKANPDGEQVSPAMKQAIAKKLEMEQKAAAANGQSVYMPAEVIETAQPIRQPVEQNRLNQYPPNAAPAPVIPKTQDEIDRANRRREGVDRQLGLLLAITEGNKQPPVRVNFALKDRAADQFSAGSTTSATTQTVAFDSNGVAKPLPKTLAQMLDIASAEVASPIDTYKTSYASARIVAGKLAGAFLIGTAKQQEDGLQISYTHMKLGPVTYQVDAIALDERTSTNAMDANVDRRYLQRWVIPITTAMVGGYASAAAKTDSSVVSSGIGSTVSSTSATADQARAAGIAAGMSILQRQVDKEANKPFQITMDANTPIGIMFRQPVVEKTQ